MGICGGSEEQVADHVSGKVSAHMKPERSSHIILYGDIFDADTRTIRSMLDLCDIENNFKEIN